MQGADLPGFSTKTAANGLMIISYPDIPEVNPLRTARGSIPVHQGRGEAASRVWFCGISGCCGALPAPAALPGTLGSWWKGGKGSPMGF